MVEVAELSERWNSHWPASPPIGHELRHAMPTRWVRFHSLPDSKRYAETAAERSTVLARHNAALADLFDQHEANARPHRALVVTCAWGDRTSRARRPDVAAADPGATFWRSDVWDRSDPDHMTWTHLWVSGHVWSAGELDPLLALVADDRTAGVIIAPLSLSWLYHPYDGGADVIAPSEAARDQIAAIHHEWVSPYAGGT